MSQNEEIIDNIEDENVCEMHSNESQENSFEESEGTDFTENSGSDSSSYFSNQHLMYFQNLDQLLNNYFSNEQMNIVMALQGLDKSIRECTSIIKDSMEQNAKCTLRVAKVLENATEKVNTIKKH
jgi:uncharacterized protein YhfF